MFWTPKYLMWYTSPPSKNIICCVLVGVVVHVNLDICMPRSCLERNIWLSKWNILAYHCIYKWFSFESNPKPHQTCSNTMFMVNNMGILIVWPSTLWCTIVWPPQCIRLLLSNVMFNFIVCVRITLPKGIMLYQKSTPPQVLTNKVVTSLSTTFYWHIWKLWHIYLNS